jgi:hypothetical protein
MANRITLTVSKGWHLQITRKRNGTKNISYICSKGVMSITVPTGWKTTEIDNGDGTVTVTIEPP